MSAVLLGLQALAAEFETLLEIKETGNEKNIRFMTNKIILIFLILPFLTF